MSARDSMETLKRLLCRGDKVYAIKHRHDRRSGASQWSFYKIAGEPLCLNHHLSRVLGYRLSRAGFVCLPFMNMDPAFEVVYCLARVLFLDGPDSGYLLTKVGM